MKIFRFTDANVLETSSPMPEDATERQYFYYAADGSERDLAANYRSGNGMIWQERPGSRGGKMSMFIFSLALRNNPRHDRSLDFLLLPVRKRSSHRETSPNA